MTDPYVAFAEKMLHKDSVYIPQILKAVIDDGQAKLLIAMPGTAADLAEKLGRAESEVLADLEDMYHKGLSFKKEKDGVLNWRAPMHLAQFHDATLVWPEATDEFIGLWGKYMEEEWPKLAPLLSKFMPRPFTRVIPVGKSLETGKARVLAPEDLRKIIEDASKIAVTKCTCRLSMKKCDSPIEVCLQVNKGAEYTIDRGSGRELTKDEALKVAEEAAEAGLIHVTMNKAGVGHFICNCCGCCCQSFTMLISDGVPLCDPSRWLAEVDAELCSACGECEERCFFGAIAVGDDDAAVVDGDKCLGCGQCAAACPEEAISMKETRPPDFIPN